MPRTVMGRIRPDTVRARRRTPRAAPIRIDRENRADTHEAASDRHALRALLLPARVGHEPREVRHFFLEKAAAAGGELVVATLRLLPIGRILATRLTHELSVEQPLDGRI